MLLLTCGKFVCASVPSRLLWFALSAQVTVEMINRCTATVADIRHQLRKGATDAFATLIEDRIQETLSEAMQVASSDELKPLLDAAVSASRVMPGACLTGVIDDLPKKFYQLKRKAKVAAVIDACSKFKAAPRNVAKTWKPSSAPSSKPKKSP